MRNKGECGRTPRVGKIGDPKPGSGRGRGNGMGNGMGRGNGFGLGLRSNRRPK